MSATKESKIPEISDEVLAERMARIKFLIPAMSGIDGKAYPTDEKDEKLFDLFFTESSVNPRTQSFNFDENRTITGKAIGLKELALKNVIIAVGGYYGFLKMTMAEVLAQLPKGLENEVVAFSLNPKEEAQVIDRGSYQLAPIIFYGKGDEKISDKSLPSVDGLIKPVDMEKAYRLQDIIKPMINYQNEGFFTLEPGPIGKPFMEVGIWLRINKSNLHRTNQETKVNVPVKNGPTVTAYYKFSHGADFFQPNYSRTISQIPDELINEKTIGLQCLSVNYFKTREGVIHRVEYMLIEKE